MILISLMDIYPAVTQMGYECEMNFMDSSAALGTFSQVYCFFKEKTTPWTVCKMDAQHTFYAEFVDQLALFFGLVLLSAPKPSISYVRVTRYLIMFSTVESIVNLCYYSMAYSQGSEFMKRSSSCVFEVTSGGNDDAAMVAEALIRIIYECLCLTFYSAFIWGSYVLVPVLKRGGTGDERVAGTDVLALVKRDPPKLLVMTSAFGVTALRIATILLTLALVAMGSYNGFNNLVRMIYWCGDFKMEQTWCRWPYGVVSIIDQGVCIALSLYTCQSLVYLRSDKKFPSLLWVWTFFAATSIALMGASTYIVTRKYPSYWFSGMRSDLWIYYVRFWLCALILVFLRSISIIRVAGGTGSEDPRTAADLVYKNLSNTNELDSLGLTGESDDVDSLDGLLGFRGPKGGNESSGQANPAAGDMWTNESAETSSRETSAIATPLASSQSVRAAPVQAVDGLELPQR